MAPKRLADWVRLAKYPSMQSVSIAKNTAMKRMAGSFCKKRKASGALRKDRLLDIVIMFNSKSVFCKRTKGVFSAHFSFCACDFFFFLYQISPISDTTKAPKRKRLNVFRPCKRAS